MHHNSNEFYLLGLSLCEFNPIIECILNGVYLVWAFKLGLLCALLITQGYVLLWCGGFMLIVTYLRARRWREKWHAREHKHNTLDIEYIESLSERKISKYKREQIITEIMNRPSKLGWSYLLFFTPQIALFSLIYWQHG